MAGANEERLRALAATYDNGDAREALSNRVYDTRAALDDVVTAIRRVRDAGGFTGKIAQASGDRLDGLMAEVEGLRANLSEHTPAWTVATRALGKAAAALESLPGADLSDSERNTIEIAMKTGGTVLAGPLGYVAGDIAADWFIGENQRRREEAAAEALREFSGEMRAAVTDLPRPARSNLPDRGTWGERVPYDGDGTPWTTPRSSGSLPGGGVPGGGYPGGGYPGGVAPSVPNAPGMPTPPPAPSTPHLPAPGGTLPEYPLPQAPVPSLPAPGGTVPPGVGGGIGDVGTPDAPIRIDGSLTPGAPTVPGSGGPGYGGPGGGAGIGGVGGGTGGGGVGIGAALGGGAIGAGVAARIAGGPGVFGGGAAGVAGGGAAGVGGAGGAGGVLAGGAGAPGANGARAPRTRGGLSGKAGHGGVLGNGGSAGGGAGSAAGGGAGARGATGGGVMAGGGAGSSDRKKQRDSLDLIAMQLDEEEVVADLGALGRAGGRGDDKDRDELGW